MFAKNHCSTLLRRSRRDHVEVEAYPRGVDRGRRLSTVLDAAVIRPGLLVPKMRVDRFLNRLAGVGILRCCSGMAEQSGQFGRIGQRRTKKAFSVAPSHT